MSDRLTDSQKRYILDNYKTISRNKISKTLGVSKRDVITFLKKQREETKQPLSVSSASGNTPWKYRGLFWSVVFLVVLVLAGVVRFGIFYMPHSTGDQNLYTIVAMKLSTQGFKGYNLREAAMVIADERKALIKIIHERDPERTILAQQKRDGFIYYDEPLFYAPPVFPYLITLSHGLFYRGRPFVFVDKDRWAKRAKEQNERPFIHDDFYRTIVPFLFGLLSVIVIILFSLRYLNRPIALWASILFCVGPISILCGSRVWADTVLTFFTSLGIFLYYIADDRNSVGLALLSGISCALAVLTKTSALFIIGVIGLYHIWANRQRCAGLRGIVSVLFDRKLLVFGVTVILLTLPWFYAVTKIFGHPLHFPSQENVREVVSWFDQVRSRPWYAYPVDLVYQNPLLILSFLYFMFDCINKKVRSITVLWFLSLLIFLISRRGVENRYLFPAYPAMVLLSGSALDSVRNWIDRRTFNGAGFILVAALILCSAYWSLKLAFRYIFVQQIDWLPFPY